MNNIPTPHINAKKDEIAKTVIMPGDPLRAKHIADTYLDDVVEINNVRNMLGYTGKYNGKEVSIIASGMGMPSMAIYSYELYEFYEVETIIRVGTAGAFSDELNIYDVVLATSALTPSNFAKQAFDLDEIELDASKELNEKIKKVDSEIVCGKIVTHDAFYKTTQESTREFMNTHNCIASEMEAFALFANAKVLNKKAACLVTIVEHMKKRQNTSSEIREKSVMKMVEIALNSI